MTIFELSLKAMSSSKRRWRKGLLVLPACQKMMLPHILSVFAAVSKFYDMTMYVLYKKYLFYMGKTGASTLTSY